MKIYHIPEYPLIFHPVFSRGILECYFFIRSRKFPAITLYVCKDGIYLNDKLSWESNMRYVVEIPFSKVKEFVVQGLTSAKESNRLLAKEILGRISE